MWRKIKVAHWIEHEHLFEDAEYECSVCGSRFDSPSDICPHCGAEIGKNNQQYEPDLVDEYEYLDMIIGDDDD